MKNLCTRSIVLLSCLASSFSYSQFGPDAARERTRDRTLAAAAGELIEDFSSTQIVETKDIAYGVQESQKLDIYLPETNDDVLDALPVLIFLHGGGFVGGDKSSAANLGKFFASNGVLTISANYRLAPENTWPSGAEDVADSIQWIHRHIEKYGGNAERIFLMGHSAGAEHVASYVFFEEFQVFEDGVVGAILSSGPTYKLNLVLNEAGTGLTHQGEAAYFGSDPSRFNRMSSINHLDGRRVPLLVAYAEADTPNIQVQNAALISALYERDQVLPSVLQAIGENHGSMISHIQSGQESVYAAQILAFINAHL